MVLALCLSELRNALVNNPHPYVHSQSVTDVTMPPQAVTTEFLNKVLVYSSVQCIFDVHTVCTLCDIGPKEVYSDDELDFESLDQLELYIGAIN